MKEHARQLPRQRALADDAASVARHEQLARRPNRALIAASVVGVLLILAAYAVWLVVPLYIEEYEINDTCRVLARERPEDGAALLARVRAFLQPRMSEPGFHLKRLALVGIAGERTITIEYVRDVTVFPGAQFEHRVHRAIWAPVE